MANSLHSYLAIHHQSGQKTQLKTQAILPKILDFSSPFLFFACKITIIRYKCSAALYSPVSNSTSLSNPQIIQQLKILMKPIAPQLSQPAKRMLIFPKDGARPNPSGSKNYIGMTLKEYINSRDIKQSIQQIQEEESESVLTLTPTHRNSPININIDKNKLKGKQKQELLGIVNNILRQPQTKIPKINLEEFSTYEKNTQKLPAIHQQRAAMISRNAISKDDNYEIKKQRCHTLKTEEIEMVNETNTTLRKNPDKYKLNDLSKHSVQMKKIGRPRVISTSFYHMQIKEKMRMKTEDNTEDKRLENMFMITRYKQNSLGKKKTEENIFKKH